MTPFRLVPFFALFFIISCGDISIPNIENGEGAACTKTLECEKDLQCISNKCTDQAKGGSGANCTKTADCQLPLQCMNGTCGDAGGQPSACPQDCLVNKCCKLRTSMAISPEVACTACTGDAQCHPQAIGFNPAEPCQNCAPAFVDKINGQTTSAAQEPFQTCYCQEEDGETFDTCVDDTLPMASNGDCNACFLGYYDCLRAACTECGLDQGPTCPDFWTDACRDCAVKTPCQDDLYSCTGGVDW